VDLTLDYWISSDSGNHPSHSSSASASDRANIGQIGSQMIGFPGSDSKKFSSDVSKNSIKTSIRYMLIQRSLVGDPSAFVVPASSGGGSDAMPTPGQNTFSMQYWLKEKKPKSKYLIKWVSQFTNLEKA
jgi:hypothetical protein